MTSILRSTSLAALAAGALLAGCVKTAPSQSKQSTGPSCDAAIVAANLSCTDPDALAAAQILRSMSLEEKVQQMSGPAYNPNNMFDQQSNTRLGIPGHLYMDGPRGVRWYNTDWGTTVFPVGEARAAGWDVELERKIGKAMAKEMRAMGRHVLLAPTVNQVSHPRWGRAQESYGEDSWLLGEMGAAVVKGIQYDPTVADPTDPDQAVEDTYRVQACVKHLAANNIEDTRIFVNAVVDDRTLREVYLPHFKKAVDAGAACVMASYNRVNGDYSCYSKPVIRGILKGEWGYQGYVISDWFAKGLTVRSAEAGLDIEMPFSSGYFPSMFESAYFYGTLLTSAVNSGQVAVAVVDEAALRILYQKIHFGLTKHAPGWAPEQAKSDAAMNLSLQAAREGITLLKNGPTKALSDDVLPLSRTTTSRIAVVGMFGNSENMGDKGSSDAKAMDGSLVVTPFEGIRDALPAANSSTTSCGAAAKCAVTFQNVAGNEALLKTMDALVVVGAYYFADLNRAPAGEEGEWKDRVSMKLPDRDLTNIANAVALKSLAGANPNLKIIVVGKSGGAIDVADWIGNVDAFVMAWFGGMKEGQALAEIFFGDLNPSGKTPQSWPMAEADLPAFDNTTQGDVGYGYFHGYRLLEKQGKAPRYPFGFGLSYTSWQYSNLQLASPTLAEDGTLTVTVDVKNVGPLAGDEVVQLYVGYPNTAVGTPGRPVKELKAFKRLANVLPDETRTVTLTVKASDLAYWNTTTQAWTVEKVAHTVFVGPSSDATDANLKSASFNIQ